MVLVSFALVVVAAIALVIGLLQSGLTIIYVSIGCSLVAGIVLVIAVMRGRPESRPATAPAARPATATAPPPPSGADQTVVSAAPPPPPPPPAPEPEPAAAQAGAASGGGVLVSDRTESLDQAEIEEAVATGDVEDFPIHDYDKLRATEVLPMLAELEEDQLLAVRNREQAGKNRFMILTRIEDELQSRQGEGWDAEDEGWTGEPAAQPVPAAAPPPAAAPSSRGGFPIPDYDDLRALEVLGRLSDLSVAELKIVRQREEAGARRAMVLNRIDRLEEEAPSDSEPLVVPPGGRASTRSRAAGPRAKKSTAAAKAAKTPARGGKAASKKAAASRAAPAKAPAAKAPAAKKAPVAKKAPAVKAPAVKAPAAKKAPLAKKATEATKAGAAKAPVAKKTAAAGKRATKRR